MKTDNQGNMRVYYSSLCRHIITQLPLRSPTAGCGTKGLLRLEVDWSEDVDDTEGKSPRSRRLGAFIVVVLAGSVKSPARTDGVGASGLFKDCRRNRSILDKLRGS